MSCMRRRSAGLCNSSKTPDGRNFQKKLKDLICSEVPLMLKWYKVLPRQRKTPADVLQGFKQLRRDSNPGFSLERAAS